MTESMPPLDCEDIMQDQLRRHEPLVVCIARRFVSPRSACFEDVKQEGLCALWKALTSFDPKKGASFSTWAYPWILHAVSREAARNTVIHVPRMNKQNSEETKQLKQKARAAVSLLVPEDGGECGDVHQDILHDKARSPAEVCEDREEYCLSMKRYHTRLAVLRPKQRQVVEARLDGATFKTIGDEMGVSRARTQQLWAEAMKKLKRVGEENPEIPCVSTCCSVRFFDTLSAPRIQAMSLLRELGFDLNLLSVSR